MRLEYALTKCKLMGLLSISATKSGEIIAVFSTPVWFPVSQNNPTKVGCENRSSAAEN